MYHINTTRILYQTSKYAPVSVMQLDISVPDECGPREQICAALDGIDVAGFGNLLPPSGEQSTASIYCDLVLGLQRSVGHSVQYYRVQETDPTLEQRVFIEYEERGVALYAAEVASGLLNGVIRQLDSFHLEQMLKEFAAYSRPRLLDSNTRLVIKAAERQNIPVLRRLLPTSLYATAAEVQNSEFKLGWGVYLHHCNGAISDKLYSADTVAQVLDRVKLYPKLIKASVPLPGQDLEFLNRNQARRAQRSARRIGYPVVLRPRAIRLFQYRFPEDYVFGPLDNDEQVGQVARYLSGTSGLDVWVESFVEGDQYRFLVINGKILSVVRCQSPGIIGDGVQSIAELSGGLDDPGVLLRLELSGLTMDSVLKAGTQLDLRNGGSFIHGDSCENVTLEMPAHFKELAIRVAQHSDLEVFAGVELTIGNLSDGVAKHNCVVTNVVLDPDLHMFEQLSEQPDGIGDEYMAALFPEGAPSRIPIVAVTGTNGKTTTCRIVTQILRAAGLKTGLACTDGLYLDNDLSRKGDSAGVSGAIELLAITDLEAVVLETARGGLANTGIAFDRCDVGACLNITTDHLGEEGIETLDGMAVHKRQVIERATDAVVLNAEDPRCLVMREFATADEVILVTHSAGHPVIDTHCQAGGRVIATIPGETGSEICIIDQTGTSPLLKVNEIPATWNGNAIHNVQNAMFAIGVALGLNIKPEIIRDTLKSFSTSIDMTPGRLNLFDTLPFKVLVDYVHNAHGYELLCRYVQQLAVTGKRTLIVYSAKRQTQAERKKIAEVVVGKFDKFICRGQHGSREVNEADITPFALRTALLEAGAAKSDVEVISDINEAVEFALLTAMSGDLIVVSATGRYRKVWDQLTAFQEGRLLSDLDNSGHDRQLDLPEE